MEIVKHYILKKGHARLSELQNIHPALGIVFYYFVFYAMTHNLPVVVTSISGKAKGRKSKTHDEFRAIDVSFKSEKWTTFHINRISHRLNKLFAKDYGTAPKGEEPRVMVVHDAGTGNHAHLQVRRFLKLLF